MTNTKLGKKIIVVGISASGKSTFSRKLAEKLKLPLTHIDAIMWKSGWEYIGDDVTAQKLQEIGLQSEWIIEGYVVKEVRTFLFATADTIVYLDYHPFVSSWRYIQRWWNHRKDPRPELQNSPDKFSFKFLKLVWTKGEAISLNRFLDEVQDQNKIITLRSPKAATDFLNKITY